MTWDCRCSAVLIRYQPVLTRKDLLKIIQARIDDADALHSAGRFDGAIYLCGYAVELALKRRICITLRWPGFPSTTAEFRNFLSFKTHALDVLLAMSGYEKKIKKDPSSFAAWSDVGSWDPQARYKLVGSASSADAQKVINSAKMLLNKL